MHGRIEAGRTTVTPGRFDVGKLFGTLRGLMKPLQVSLDVELVNDVG